MIALGKRYAVLVAAATLAAVGMLGAAPARAADLDSTLMLVAKRELNGNFYGSTILLAKPVGNGRHVGFIINRPTEMTLGRLFPGHPASQKVPEPVYLGGPFNTQFIYALVQRHDSPGGRSVQIAPDLFAAIDAETVDHIIETDAAHARFFAGMVAWRPGELRQELERGLWYALEAEPEVVMRKPTEGLWEELVIRSEHRANGI